MPSYSHSWCFSLPSACGHLMNPNLGIGGGDMMTRLEQEAAKRVKRLKARAAKAERRIKQGKNVEQEQETLARMLHLLEVK